MIIVAPPFSEAYLYQLSAKLRAPGSIINHGLEQAL
jgi:hypothetical protein